MKLQSKASMLMSKSKPTLTRSSNPFKILERLLRSLKTKNQTKDCNHLFQDVNEIDGWCRCQDCGEFFPYEELDFCPDENAPPCWTQSYSSRNHFSQCIKKLQLLNLDLPSGDLVLEPLQIGFRRFEEAYSACRFFKGGKEIGEVRCVFPPCYIVYQLASTLSISDPSIELCGWAELAKSAKALVAPKRMADLDLWWEQINAQMPDGWRRKNTRSLDRFRKSKAELCASS